MADTSSTRGGWAFRPLPPEPRSLVALIREGTLDAELAATVWVLLDGRAPLVVAGAGPGTGRSTLLDAFLDTLPTTLRTVELEGETETFEWLPQASELGWSGGHRTTPTGSPGSPSVNADPVRPDATVLVASQLSDGLPSSTWGDGARLAIRAASVGYGLATTIDADSLEDVFESLRRPPVRLDDDELSWLGVVLILRVVDGDRRRVVAAHYVRPTARDVHGHLQRLGPAVLATWDPGTDRFEQFGWGVTPELALRVGLRAGDFEIDVDRRRTLLEDLVRSGVVEPDAVRQAMRTHRATTTTTATN